MGPAVVGTSNETLMLQVPPGSTVSGRDTSFAGFKYGNFSPFTCPSFTPVHAVLPAHGEMTRQEVRMRCITEGAGLGPYSTSITQAGRETYLHIQQCDSYRTCVGEDPGLGVKTDSKQLRVDQAKEQPQRKRPHRTCRDAIDYHIVMRLDLFAHPSWRA